MKRFTVEAAVGHHVRLSYLLCKLPSSSVRFFPATVQENATCVLIHAPSFVLRVYVCVHDGLLCSALGHAVQLAQVRDDLKKC